MPLNDVILHIEGLRKSFGDVEVLKGIDLELSRKEMLFLIGPSGSGKSTLLRCCNRLEEPSSGVISFDGENILSAEIDVNRLRQKMGMVFQSFNLYPHMTALGNVTLALRKVLERPKREADDAGGPCSTRSGSSTKQMLTRASSPEARSNGSLSHGPLALEPQTLLMDEPTSSLDPELVGSVLKVIRELRASGMTMLIVSHEMAFAREAADRVSVHGCGRDRRAR